MTEEELNEMAEKYALSKWEGQVPWGLIAQGYKDGYLEGLKAKINATTISDCPHKDEWHYPSKGEYPTTEEEVLVYLWDSFYIGTYCLDSSEINRWHFNDFDEQSDQITAWLYIEPPKEEE